MLTDTQRGQRNQCVECGNRHDNYDLICDTCAPLYADEPKPDQRFDISPDPANL